MRKWSILFIIIIIFLSTTTNTIYSSVTSIGEENQKPKPKRIILIGWDGVQRNHLYEIMEDPEKLSNLKNLSAEGNFVEIDITSAATDTKAGWSQILTGYTPDITGVWSNQYFQTIPEGYTIFERLNKSFGDENIFTIMVTGKSKNIGSEEGFPFNNSIQHIDKYELDVEREAKDVWKLAKNHLNDYLENHSHEHLFAFIHFREPDHIGHVLGENDDIYTEHIVTNDLYLEEIVGWFKYNNMYDDTLIYLTSDHGFDEEGARFPVYPKEPGKQHWMAPYVFLATNDKNIRRDGDRSDIAPTILNNFGINLNEIKPPLSGTPLSVEKLPEEIDYNLFCWFINI